MKIPEKLNPSRFLKKDRKGVALVTVLTVMSLTTILVLTFFSLATSEHAASNTYSHGLQAQQVGEQAVNMVIAQIREATSMGDTFAWASQPGAIRTWSDKSGDNEEQAYKLYSDDVMKTEDWTEFKKDFDDAKTWSTRPETFVDLNEPVIRGEKVYYPIVHPAASTEPKWSRPLGGDKDGVEGFRYNQDGEVLSDVGALGEKARKLSRADGHVAMPVRWIYQLADGTLGSLSDSPSGGGPGGPGFGFKAFVGNVEPSEKNPMVARFAFWADDETTKLNVNVHAGGVAWDIPKAGGALDRAMGEYQPAAKEFQRYSGHPASTHLGPALAPGLLDVIKEKRAMELLYKVVPRIVGGGSEAGTRIINTNDPKERNGLIADTEPLFPSLDDVIMRSDRKPHEYPDGTTGNAVPPDKLSEYLERAKFFVTVNSRAPETNIFNKPKIAMWPIFNASEKSETYQTKLTAFDRLIHYCSSMGKSTGNDYPRHEYIFKRENPHSPTDDYKKIPRNEALYKYLIALTKKKIPGYGRSYEDKYGEASTAQLITMMFDYIRMTNLHDDTLFEDDLNAFQVDNKDTYLTYTNPRDRNDTGFGLKGHGQVSPIEIEGTKGMGRFYSLSGAHILVTCVGMPGFLPNSLYAGAQALETSKPYENHIDLDQGAGDLYTNLPPLPPAADKADPAKTDWPQWLKDLETLGASDAAAQLEFDAAFDPNNWNWQLAFMDTGYRDAVLASPTTNKFNRALITLANCENMRLKPNERLVQATFLFDLFSPSIGWNSINPNMEIRIKRNSGMTFNGVDGPVGFLGFGDGGTYNKAVGDPDTFIWATNWSKPGTGWGGFLPFQYTMQGVGRNDDKSPLFNIQASLATPGIRSRLTPLDKGYDQLVSGVSKVQTRQIGGQAADIAQAYRYDLVTYPFKVPYQGANKTLVFNGGEVNFQVFDRSKHTESSQPSLRTAGTTPVQDVTIEFDDFAFLPPLMSPGQPSWIDEYDNLSRDTYSALELASLTADPGSKPTVGPSEGKARTRTGAMHSRVRTAKGKVPVNANNPVTSFGRMALIGSNASGSWGGLFVARNDILQSYAVGHGDMRLAASKRVITHNDKIFQPHRLYGKQMMAHSLTNANGWPVGGMSRTPEYYIVPDLPNSPPPYTAAPYHRTVPMPFATEKSRDVQLYGDFDNGAGTMIDGAYINKPDEGNVHGLNGKFANGHLSKRQSNTNSNGSFPYFSAPHLNEPGGPAYFSPNRMVSGPGMFGSLPTGLGDSPPKPWQTLLFRPNVEGNYYTSHPGAGKGTGSGASDPPDHLLMDLFWMPVVEPYAISEPLSTAGKVNMNYQIVPFLHIHRDTALRGVFRSEFMLCVPNKWNGSYKYNYGRGIGYNARYDPKGGVLEMLRLRSAIEDTATLNQFQARFNKGAGMFKSSSEICEIHLIPEDVSSRVFQSKTSAVGTYTPTVDQMKSGKYWRDHAVVGDNSRERPYTNIQTRLTTKSNTFLVHYRAQVIKQSRRESSAEYAKWQPTVDTVQAEYRGSSLVERYVNPNDKDIPDFTKVDEKRSIDEFYNYRVVNPRRFAP